MAGVNKVILIGNLGIDPEVRTLESGTKVARLSVATSETYTNKDGARIEETEWHSVTLWRNLAEIAEKYLRKGNKVYLEGRLRTRSYTDKQGIQKYTTEIVCDNMQMLGGGGPGSDTRSERSEPSSSEPTGNRPAQKTAPSSDGNGNDQTDDLPF